MNVEHTTIYHKGRRYEPEMENNCDGSGVSTSVLCSWYLDETYIKANGRWAYLYRGVDSKGHLINFYLSSRRNSKAVYCFLGKTLNNAKDCLIMSFATVPLT
ncbi:DDE-type integrase/transposase/recombinase [Enterobacter cloacae]|uniref:DDE-type integrase/transposase/recombinase n=1 Tax=Enterobacter cloacae TaxID=550 RepID=UPI000B8D65CF|nr:hypothetical protein BJM06_a00192 [Enterobacter cloacae]